MRIAIVDDDELSIRMLTVFLNRYFMKNNLLASVDEFYSGPELMKSFEADSYDAIFMDIYMNEMTGIETAGRIRETDINCKIIFVSSSDEHMSAAFPCHAFDYLVKPIIIERLFAVMDDLVRVLPQTERFIEITHERKQKKIAFSNIKCVISSGHYLLINDAGNNEYSVRMNFSDFSSQIAEDARFLSINKGLTVNMDYVADIADGACVMTDGTVYPVRIREKNSLENIWENYKKQ